MNVKYRDVVLTLTLSYQWSDDVIDSIHEIDVLEPALSQHRLDTINLAWYKASLAKRYTDRLTAQSTSVPDRTYI